MFLVKLKDFILNLLTIPSDILFATKASGENTDDNSFATLDTNSFIISNSKQSARRSRRSRSSKASNNDAYIMQLDRKIDDNYKLNTGQRKTSELTLLSIHQNYNR